MCSGPSQILVGNFQAFQGATSTNQALSGQGWALSGQWWALSGQWWVLSGQWWALSGAETNPLRPATDPVRQTCAKIRGRSEIQELQDPGSGILTDFGSWTDICFRRIEWILDRVHTVFAGSCGSWILFRKIAAGFWGSWILLRDNAMGQVSLQPLNTLFWWTMRIFGASCNVFFRWCGRVQETHRVEVYTGRL